MTIFSRLVVTIINEFMTSGLNECGSILENIPTLSFMTIKH